MINLNTNITKEAILKSEKLKGIECKENWYVPLCGRDKDNTYTAEEEFDDHDYFSCVAPTIADVISNAEELFGKKDICHWCGRDQDKEYEDWHDCCDGFVVEKYTHIQLCIVKMCQQDKPLQEIEKYILKNIKEEKQEDELVKVYTDGATVGHNGKLGTVSEVGLGLYIPSLNLKEGKRVNGISNNEAEFKALIWGMETAIENGIRRAIFYMDSRIVVNRANGSRPRKARDRNERMDAFQDEVIKLKINHFDEIHFEWIPREENTVADEYSKIAIKN